MSEQRSKRPWPLVDESDPVTGRELLVAWLLLALIIGVAFYFAC